MVPIVSPGAQRTTLGLLFVEAYTVPLGVTKIPAGLSSLFSS